MHDHKAPALDDPLRFRRRGRTCVRLLAGIATVLMLTGAMSVSIQPGADATAGPLLVGNTDRISAIDPDTGNLLFDAGEALATADGSQLVQATADDEDTRIAQLDAATGDEQTVTHIDGTWELRLLSADGTTAVLMPPKANGVDPYLPEARTSTSMLLVHLDGRSPERFDLDGNYEPEALSTDGSALFVIEYTPALAPEQYQVRQLDLASGTVHDVFSRDKELQEAMGGNARTQVASPAGDRLYTLYTLGNADGTRQAFIHVLSLDEQWAHCIDLPAGVAIGPQFTTALAVSPDGDRLYVVDGAGNRIVDVDTDELTIVDSEYLDRDESEPARVSAAAASDDAVYASIDDTITVHDSKTLEEVASWVVSAPAISIQLERDLVYLALPDRLQVLDPADGTIEEIFRSGERITRFVGPSPEPPQPQRGGLECAC